MQGRFSYQVVITHCDPGQHQFQCPDIFEPWTSEHLQQQTQCIYTEKDSGYSDKREKITLSCQKMQNIWEVQVKNCAIVKSFKLLNKSSTSLDLQTKYMNNEEK